MARISMATDTLLPAHRPPQTHTRRTNTCDPAIRTSCIAVFAQAFKGAQTSPEPRPLPFFGKRAERFIRAHKRYLISDLT